MSKLVARINGKKYDTGESTEIAVGLYDEDANPYSKSLMKKKNGEYFFVTSGSPESKYGFIDKNGEKRWGCRIIPITKEEAEEFLKEEGVVLLGC